MTRLRSALALLAVLAVAVVVTSRRREAPSPVPQTACGDGASCGEAEPVGTSAAPSPLADAPEVRPSTTATVRVPAATESAPAAAAAPVRREDVDRLLAAGKVVEAVEAFRAVVAAEPTAKNHGDFGSLLGRLTAFDEAAVHLRAAAELDPGNADRWIALANVYYRKVNPGEAWKAEKRARAAEPGLELGRDAEGMRVRKIPPTSQGP